MVVHEPLQGAHDLFAPQVGWRANDFPTSESASRREPAGESARYDLGESPHARVLILPGGDERSRCGLLWVRPDYRRE
jgi:hypothetical protein